MPMILCQLSDLHLSGRHGYFYENWRGVVAYVNQLAPDAVVISGDLTINGADDVDDLRFARSELQRLPNPWWALPGNHDVGEEPDALHLGQPIYEVRHGRYVAIMGSDHWSFELGDWRLIGINSQLLGSGLPAEREQRDWLDRVLAQDARPVGVFLHKPLFLTDPMSESSSPSTLGPATRIYLLDLFASSKVRFVASGHLHQYGVDGLGDIEFIWAPSTAFPAAGSDTMTPHLGLVIHELDGADHAHRYVSVPGLVLHDLDALKGNGEYKWLYQTPACPPVL